MKLKIFKPAIAMFVVCFTAVNLCFAQTITAQPGAPVIAAPVQPADAPLPQLPAVAANANTVTAQQIDTKRLQATISKVKTQVRALTIMANTQLKVAMKELASANVKITVPQIALDYNDMGDGPACANVNHNENADDVNQVKNYSKVYPANADDNLVIDNRYGSVIVNTWDKDQFKVDVQVKVNAGSESDAQNALDNVNISDAKDGQKVSFRTDIVNVNSSWLSWLTGSHSNHRIEINYTVYMPAKNDLTIANSYGSIVLPDLSGKVTVRCSYGNFTAKSITNQNAIEVKYGNANIDNSGPLAIRLGYGSLNLGTVDKLEADINYSPVKIARIRVSGAINAKYSGDLQIGDIDKNMKSLAINASYSNVNIGLSGDENADFAVTVHYGEFNYGDRNITFTSKPPDDSKKFHPTKSYKGSLGKGNPDKTIAINSDYGNVKFN